MTQTELAGKRILCVEDEALVAMLLEDILVAMGCVIIGPFARAADALLRLEQDGIDGAVLDVNLRGERSYALADELLSRDIPFVFVTGYGASGLAPEYRHHPVVQKPFHRNGIATALSDAIAR